ERALGIHFWTPEGKRFIDFNSQLMSVNIGHSHPRVIAAMKKALDGLIYSFPASATEPRARLGKLLAELMPDPLSPVGIEASALNARQQGLLMEIIEVYVSVMSDEIAALRRAKLQEDGFDNFTFAWAGGTSYGEVSYFRVQGPSFLIEFDHTQRDPNHVHSGWRDFDGDFGRDVLREHLAGQAH
ncbi:MAG TPA: aminotransferase class III-fold pyridoxal phosphate-dependent enzyme, partial [Gemmatimonadetes bacterium]|nr:aminotransferase class III-fold pyridoxal phosphate-dependent enzyme [Gemmatimonadota bacterium]